MYINIKRPYYRSSSSNYQRHSNYISLTIHVSTHLKLIRKSLNDSINMECFFNIYLCIISRQVQYN